MAMRILIINDDGIKSQGIKILTDFAKTLGEVTVVAPLVEQSGKSQSIEYREPYTIEKVDYDEGVTAYAVNSTPSDCARFAIFELGANFDLVLTGINKGFNLGNDVLYSGTAGSACECVARGLKAIAFSTVYSTFDSAKENLKRVYDYFLENKLLDKHDFYNVNIPLDPKDIKITRKSGFYYKERFDKMPDGKYLQTTDFASTYGNDMTLDVDATLNGHISITPLTVDRTDLKAFDLLKELNNK